MVPGIAPVLPATTEVYREKTDEEGVSAQDEVASPFVTEDEALQYTVDANGKITFYMTQDQGAGDNVLK